MPTESPPKPARPAALGTPENPVLIDIADGAFFERSADLYADLRGRCPVARARFRVPELDEPTDPEDTPVRASPFAADFWLVTHYDRAVEVLQDDVRLSIDLSVNATAEERAALDRMSEEERLLSRTLLSMDPPDHTRLRKLVQPWFNGPAMDAMRPRIHEITASLLDEAEAEAARRQERAPDRAMDLIDAFAYPLPVAVISDMLGIPAADRAEVRGWAERLLTRRSRNPARLLRAELRRFTDYLRDQVDRKRRHPEEDLISFLAGTHDGGEQLAEDEMLSMIFLLFIAGHVTTVNLIGNAVAALLRWPDQMAAVRANPGLVKNLIEETLRYWGPVENAFPRIALERITFGGVVIEPGERVSAGIASAARDPAKFVDPDRFDVTRGDARKHFAFGRGIHTCLGAPLARLEATIAIGALLERYPILRPGTPVESLRWNGRFLRGYEHVPVLF